MHRHHQTRAHWRRVSSWHNILIRKTGHLFHIDFGFIFGRDPKPYPPPIKITKQMINGMGGPRSPSAYKIIRRSANLLLSLLTLMKDTNIPDMQPDPDAVIDRVRDKFRLDCEDLVAERAFLKVVDDSVAALFPHISDFIHTIATKLR
jgi:phosphatidylinositol 3-kinase